MKLESPNILVVAITVADMLYFLALTVTLRVTFPLLKWSWAYLQWSRRAHLVRQVIAFRTILMLKEISPESYRGVRGWTLE